MPMTRCETITWNTGIPPVKYGDRTYERTIDVLLRVTNGKKFAYCIAYMVRLDPDDEFVWKMIGPDAYEVCDEVVEWAILE
jgi:hypothetical protein